MSIEEEEEEFEKTDICWICNKLIENDHSKSEIIVILMENIEVKHIGIVILT